ncbi:MAG: hypothetical protein AB1758_34355 [Candidatus Eremiobacterota bacterium]
MKPYFLSALHPLKPRALRGTPEGDLCLVDWRERRVLHRWSAGSALCAVAFHPERDLAASLGPEGVQVWEDDRRVAAFPHPGDNLALVGDRLLVASPGKLKGLDLATGSVVFELERSGLVHPALLAVSDELVGWSAMAATEILLLRPDTGQVVRTLGSLGEVFSLSFHPDGKRLLACVTDRPRNVLNVVRTWSLVSGEPERHFPVPFLSVALRVSPDGAWVVTGDAMGAQLWDFAQGQPERRFARREAASIGGLELERPKAGLVSALRLDGDTLVTDGAELAAWQFGSGELLWSLEVSPADV